MALYQRYAEALPDGNYQTMLKRAGHVLLDRDGTIIAEKNYLSTPGEVELLEGAAEGLKLLYDRGFSLIVVSNQSGIGRGFFTARDLVLVQRRLEDLLASRGVRIDGFYYCPHAPQEGCLCRKPGLELISQAAADFEFDPRNSWIIGDKSCDMEAARRCGAHSILVRTGYGAEQEAEHEITGLMPDRISDNLTEAANYLIQQSRFSPIRLADQSVDRLRSHVRGSIETKLRLLAECESQILELAEMCAVAFGSGRKLLFCGNGGSAADCQHIAAEFISVLTKQTLRPGLPAIALTTDSSILTASANDFGFEGVFARQVQALGHPGDVLIAISTSGNSTNVIRALEYAREHGMRTAALTGESAIHIEGLCDVVIRVPSAECSHIQEAHIMAAHILCDLIEQSLLAAGVFGAA